MVLNSLQFSGKNVFTSICIGAVNIFSNFYVLHNGNHCRNHCEYFYANIKPFQDYNCHYYSKIFYFYYIFLLQIEWQHFRISYEYELGIYDSQRAENVFSFIAPKPKSIFFDDWWFYAFELAQLCEGKTYGFKAIMLKR